MEEDAYSTEKLVKTPKMSLVLNKNTKTAPVDKTQSRTDALRQQAIKMRLRSFNKTNPAPEKKTGYGS